jgi:hypothetical protein
MPKVLLAVLLVALAAAPPAAAKVGDVDLPHLFAGQIAKAKARTDVPILLSCGASCSPPSIEWRERGATYRIQAKVLGSERRAPAKLANSAIRRGPR